jgi:ABC-type branched-subunit amino acid transport system substrate-binding protein
VTRLLASRPDVILTTSWGGDLVTLVRQASERRLFERSTFVMPVAEASMQILGRTMPAGHIIGARGDHWNNHPKPKDPAKLAKFVEAYRAKHNEYPIYPCHHMAQAISALQAAYARVAAACAAHGKVLGMGGVYDEVWAPTYAALGARFILGGSDHVFLMAGASARARFLAGL